MALFKGLFHYRDKPQNALNGSAFSFLFGGTSSGKAVNERSAMQMTALFGGTSSGKAVNERSAMQMTAVYACVRILSEAVASLPLHVYCYADNGSKEKALNHRLYMLLHDEPNPEMTSFIFRETLMSHLLLYGNAYAQIVRNGKGEVIGLYPLMPGKMTVDRDKAGRLYYAYSRTGEDSPALGKDSTVILTPADVLHIPGLGFDGLVGYSPIAMAKNSIGMAIACEEYGASFFANGAAPGGEGAEDFRTHYAGQMRNHVFRVAFVVGCVVVAEYGGIGLIASAPLAFIMDCQPQIGQKLCRTRCPGRYETSGCRRGSLSPSKKPYAPDLHSYTRPRCIR